MTEGRVFGCVLTLALAVAGCGAGRTSISGSGASAPGPSAVDSSGKPSDASTARSPEGVVLEVAAPMPPPAASAGADGVVVLAEPAPDEAIRDVLFAFFDAVRRRDGDAIRQMFSESAVSVDRVSRSRQGDREAAITQVASVMRSIEVAKVIPSEIVTPERVDRYALADLAAGGQKKPEGMTPLDTLIALTMPPPRIPGDKVFEPVVMFVLRPEGGKLRIAAVWQEPSP